ncbi:leucine-rich repeat-containing G-protein coupled receptor 4-like isoform X1 [Mytilus trossulus]|uniref:leucine-rich repeat-containing G-protein coupled receptor 4-like isoform X1 n=1 Tax=Mytilus trossulus TaxID=6551 RepID=UPI003004C3E6
MEKIYNTIFIIACTIYGCTVNGCPSLCRCTSTNVVYCSGKSLTTVPSNIPNSTTLLYISQNKITLKDDYAFAGLSALKIMYINDNKITRINEHSFDGLSALTHLYIHGNNITIIDGHSFDGLSALTHLYLEENTLDCSKCELKKFKAFLLTTKRVFVGGASCDGRPLIYHNFNNCKETITTEAFPSSAGKDNPESTTESITGNQASTTKSTTGIQQTQNIVYISCGVCFFLILSCSIASFHVGKKYQSAQINKKSGRNQFININNGTEVERDAQMSPNIATSRGNGQDDAEIDELEMPDLS